MEFERTYGNRSVLITGHSGFTGGWLSTWLLDLGAKVTGVSLPPESSPNLFELLQLKDRLFSVMADINDLPAVENVFDKSQPEIVFHLAAQPLVSSGYSDPAGTFRTNVLGTLHVLETARHCPATKSVVCITTDKVYSNKDGERAYREEDRLGGKDPYSASKACAELLADCYRQTMLERGNGLALATARGGNIVGGGDWADNRIVPDFVRALSGDFPLVIRNPNSIRPWQHVLALVYGYLKLGDALLSGSNDANQAWNFGSLSSEAYTVQSVVETLARNWAWPQVEYGEGNFQEAHILNVDSTKARTVLGWQPPWDFDESLRMTARWYQSFYDHPDRVVDITHEQINSYRSRIAGL